MEPLEPPLDVLQSCHCMWHDPGYPIELLLAIEPELSLKPLWD